MSLNGTMKYKRFIIVIVLFINYLIYRTYVCRFHTFNGTRQSETVPSGASLRDDELYARPDARAPKVANDNQLINDD